MSAPPPPSPPPRPPAEVLAAVKAEPRVVGEFAPLYDSQEWELAQAAWGRRGVDAFVRNEVPFLVHNTGRLSEHVAALLFASCCEGTTAEAAGPVVVAEVGAGLGLFARYLLDSFRAICQQEKRAFYDRLTVVVTDGAARTVEGWRAARLFEGHEGHVVLGTCDARAPGSFQALEPAGAAAPELTSLRAVFCNYVLDVLPATIVRRRADQLEELWVRSVLRSESEPEAFDLETTFRPLAGAGRAVAEEAAAACPEAERLVVNFGAVEALRAWLPRLAEEGFLLVNDYGGPTVPGIPQRFGPTLAFGLDFPMLERLMRAQSVVVEAPPGDAERAVHTRLLARRERAGRLAAFRNRFSAEADRHFDLPVEEARAHLAAGRQSQGLDSYREALARSPRDWRLLGEIAEFVGLQLRDYPSAIQLARGALALNPWFSAWLWNVLGDCLFCDQRLDEAHAAYQAAQRIDAEDPRTNLNLAYTLERQGAVVEALGLIARGLAADPRGLYRARLLDKQAQLLSALSARHAAAEEQMNARLERLR